MLSQFSILPKDLRLKRGETWVRLVGVLCKYVGCVCRSGHGVTEHQCSPVFPRGPVDIRISKDGKRSGVNLNLLLFFTPKLLLFSLKYTNLHRTAQHSVSRYLQCPQRPLKFLSSTPVVGLSVLRKGQCLHYLTTRHGSISSRGRRLCWASSFHLRLYHRFISRRISRLIRDGLANLICLSGL